VVKPSANVGFRRSHKRQLFRCETPAELERAYELAAPHEPMVQELIPSGPEEMYTLGSYLDRDGEALGLFSGHKLSQTRGYMGSARAGEAVWVDEVVELGLKLLRSLGFHGLSQVELKRDARDGAYKLMEVNPRLWQWHGLAAACGVDFPLIAYRDLTGERLEPVSTNGHRRRWAITLLPGEPPAPQRPPYVDAVFAWDDLRPALVQVARLLRR
jgi:predicted ATP-grasp superfamily ATP-dependent carboligase